MTKTIKILLEAQARGVAQAKSQLTSIAQVERAHGRAIAQTGRERAQTERAHAQANRLLAKEKQALTDNTRQLGMYGAAVAGVVAAVGTKAVNAFTDFQASQNQVKSVTNATSSEMQRMKNLALEMGASTKFSAKEASDATSFLAMAGLNVQQVIGALPSTLKLAAAGNLDLAKAADISTNVMSGMRLEVSDLDRVIDVMAKTASTSNTNVEQLGHGFSFVAPVAAAAGVSVEEAAGAMGILANNAFQGEKGGTALRGIIARLIDPSSKAARTMDDLGINVMKAEGGMRPLTAIMADMEKQGISSGTVMSTFGQRAGPALLALLGEGSTGLAQYTEDLYSAEGAAQKMADTQQEGLVGSMTRPFVSYRHIDD